MKSTEEVTNVLTALDLAKAHVPKDWEYLSTVEEVQFQVMELEYNEKPLCVHLGVSKDIFPPADQLENDEIKAIVEKIVEVWAVYNYIADLPDGLPVRIAYDTLLSVWDETVPCFPFGHFHFDFYELELQQYVDPTYKKIL